MIISGRPLAFVPLLACVTSASLNCNTRSTPFDPALSSPPASWTVTSPSAPDPRLAKIEIGPTGGIGPLSGTGTVTLDSPAPDGGMTISLRSTTPSLLAVSPGQVTVGPGAYTATFSFAAAEVAADTTASIIASASERELSASVALWAVLPAFYSYAAGESGLLAPETRVRRTPSTGSSFDARCIGNVVTAVVDHSSQLQFAAANGQPLRAGIYENAHHLSSGHRMPFFLAGQAPNSCVLSGRFEVREIEYAPDGLIRKLWISFEQRCVGQPGTLRGDVRTASVPNNPWRGQCRMP